MYADTSHRQHLNAKDSTAFARWYRENNWRCVWNLLEFEYQNRLQQAIDTPCTACPYRYALQKGKTAKGTQIH